MALVLCLSVPLATQLTSVTAGPTPQTIGPSSVYRLHTVWSYRAVLSSAIASGDRIYALVATGHVTFDVVELDSRTGKRLRTFTASSLRLQTRPTPDSPEALAYARGRLIVAATRQVLAINPDTGSRFWSAGGGATELTVAGNTIFTAKYCQNVCGTLASYAINLANGRVLWKHAGNFGAAPALIAGRLYQTVGPAGEETRVYDPSSGALVATLRFGGQWLGDSRTAYVFAQTLAPSGPVHRVWLGRISATGKPAWKLDLGKPGEGAAVLAGGSIFVPSNRFHPGVIGVKASNGHILWGADVGKDVDLLESSNLLFVLRHGDGRLQILKPNNGQLARQLTIPGFGSRGTFGLLMAGDTLAVLHANGIVGLRA